MRKITLEEAIDIYNNDNTKIKTLEEVQAEMDFGDVYTISDFSEQVSQGSISDYDGIGYFHNGHEETEVCVFDPDIPYYMAILMFPYVCWYNK